MPWPWKPTGVVLGVGLVGRRTTGKGCSRQLTPFQSGPTWKSRRQTGFKLPIDGFSCGQARDAASKTKVDRVSDRRSGRLHRTPTPKLKAIRMKTRLLLVEDDEDLREALQRLISNDNEGIVIHAVPGVFKAISRAAVHAYDLVVLDLHLPDGDGFDVLDQVRRGRGQTTADVPVVIFSSLDPDLVAPLSGAKGADAYFPKSELGREHLRRWIRKAVAASRAKRTGAALG